MSWASRDILDVLDRACRAFTFPMLDNGYVYLAATRLSLFRSVDDWAMVIEVFGYSPRAGLPDLHVYTFGSNLHARDSRDQYASQEAWETYLSNNLHNESRFFHPLDEGDWLDPDDSDFVGGGESVVVRGLEIELPVSRDDYVQQGIEPEEDYIKVFELCRYLAGVARDEVLATPEERRISVRPEMQQILQLEEWQHPDVAEEEPPSESVSFQQLAEVLATGDVSCYVPGNPTNTHWSNWPEGGTL